MVKATTDMCNVFYRCRYLQSNDTIVDSVLYHFVIRFQGQTISCYEYAIEIVQRQ